MNATRRSADTLKSKRLILYAVIFIPLICLSGSALTADETPTGSDDATVVQTSASSQLGGETQPSRSEKWVDAVVDRPLTFGETIVGGALFACVAPFAALGGWENLQDAANVFVVSPYENTFIRPLGVNQ